MKRCDPRARAKCLDRKSCELGAIFADGSECDKFNEKCLEETPTIADHIRAMSDFELMQFLGKLDSQDLDDVIKFCGKSHVCDELDVDEITEGMCQRCLLAQLQQPYAELADYLVELQVKTVRRILSELKATGVEDWKKDLTEMLSEEIETIMERIE